MALAMRPRPLDVDAPLEIMVGADDVDSEHDPVDEDPRHSLPATIEIPRVSLLCCGARFFFFFFSFLGRSIP